MRPGQQQQHNKQRMRGRNNNGNRKGPNPLSRSFESNGPDVKIRGTAQHIADKYTTLARDAAASGDRVMAENYLQHAEHYGRIVAAAQGQFQPSQPERDYLDEDEDGFDGAEGGASQQPAPFAGQNHQNTQNHQNQPPRDVLRDGGGQPRGNERGGEGRRDDFRENRRDRFGNRDNQGRDFNRDGGRDGQNGRPPQGTGPQPYPRESVEGEEGQVAAQDGRGGEGRREHRRDRQRFNDRNGERRFEERFGRGRGGEDRPAEGAAAEAERRDDAPAAPRQSGQDVPGGGGETPPSAVAPAAPVQDASPAGEAISEAPRRRGRAPRRADAETAAAGQADAPSGFRDAASTVTAGSEAAADEKAASEPKRRAGRAAAAPAEPEGEAAPKRKPGRPRKKKPEADEGEGDLGKLPDFLLASNG